MFRGRAPPYSTRTRFRSDKNVADTKLEDIINSYTNLFVLTSLSADVFIGSFVEYGGTLPLGYSNI